MTHTVHDCTYTRHLNQTDKEANAEQLPRAAEKGKQGLTAQ